MNEDPQAEAHRRLQELLNELRVALPGVQMLFGFMLILPFSNGFSKLTSGERLVYFGAFLATTVATALFIAPTIYHRLVFRRHQLQHLVVVANRMAIAGTVFLAVALIGSVYVITAVMYSPGLGIAMAACLAVGFGWLWFAMPLGRRRRFPADS
ncbi:MAG TPA: DUF6328 family protein [Actinomycetota bacterium]|jgi:hypothetical protein